MVRNRPIVSSTSERYRFEHCNEIANCPSFRNIFQRCFGGSIFPPDEIFELAEAPLYISERKWMADTSFAAHDPKYKYEELLDSLFWDHSEAPLTFLVGTVGCGKSTLLDFYLRCYCPTVSPHRDKFTEKLVIYVDAKGIDVTDSFNHKFFTKLRNSIISRCKAANYDILSLVDVDAKKQPVQWVDEALAVFTERINNEQDFPFKYFVVAIDNLDQTDGEVQSRAMALVKQWLEPGSTFRPYRVYIPAWPETLDALYTKLGDPIPIELTTTVQVGRTEGAKVLEARVREVIARIQTSAVASVGNTEPIGNKQIRQYVAETYEYLNFNAGKFLNELCHNNLRMQIHIWDNLLSSRVVFRHWRDGFRASVPSRIPYCAIDGMLTGKTRVFNEEKANIANVYAVATDNALIGPHLLYLLDGQEKISKARVRADLARLGHTNASVDEALLWLKAVDLVHEVVGIGQADLVVHQSAIQRYLELLYEPAYLDNVSMVTPFDISNLSANRATTDSLNTNYFVPRVETSLKFLDFLGRLESKFASNIQERIGAGGADAIDLFSFVEREFPLPTIFVRGVARYRERLEQLRLSNRLAHARGVSQHWWETQLQMLDAKLEGTSTDPHWQFKFVLQNLS